ncbi:MAG: riboflavin synthase, partial [Vampirovibrionales bacterium]
EQLLDEYHLQALTEDALKPSVEHQHWMQGGGALLSVQLPPEHLSGERLLTLGDSIALDGACYTVVTLSENQFQVVASPETRQKTILSSYTSGQLLHYEYPLRLQDPLGGHWVSGHVDMACPVLAMVPEGNAWRMVFGIPSQEALELIVPKGSVTLNGVSLTVNTVAQTPHPVGLSSVPEETLSEAFSCLQALGIPCHGWFDVCLIPHTWEVTRMASYRTVTSCVQAIQDNPQELLMTSFQLSPLWEGAWVNLELDMMGKMIHQRLKLYLEAQTSA